MSLFQTWRSLSVFALSSVTLLSGCSQKAEVQAATVGEREVLTAIATSHQLTIVGHGAANLPENHETLVRGLEGCQLHGIAIAAKADADAAVKLVCRNQKKELVASYRCLAAPPNSAGSIGAPGMCVSLTQPASIVSAPQ